MNPSSQTPSLPIPPVPVYEVVPVAESASSAEPVPTLARLNDSGPVPTPTLRRIDEHKPSTPPQTAWSQVVDAATQVSNIFDAVVETVLGIGFMPLGLAILASLPLFNFVALGYLLEAGGRIARTDRLRDGFFGIRRAGRLGGLLFGVFLTILPVWFISSMVQSAELIDPTSTITRNWKIGMLAATVFAVIHIALACLWGGKFRHFLLPFLHPFFAIFALVRGNPITRARDGVWTFLVEARPWYYFWLGFRGAMGALVWLALPVTLLALGWKFAPLGFLGFFLLLPVLMILPFLQIQMTARNRFSGMFDVVNIFRLYMRAPWSCSFALFITLLFALPLYLLKIELVPRDALVLPALVFIAFIWPARLLTGWVCGKAIRRQRWSHWFFWTTGAIPVPVFLVVYGFFVWLSQYISWYGVGSLYEQHAFLLPVPFTGL